MAVAKEAVQGLQPKVELRVAMRPGYAEVLRPDAFAFLGELHARFENRRRALVEERAARQARFDAGELPDFLPETRDIRESDWRVASVPDAIADRRVEITGPVDRKMIINALNSGAKVFMADFEDSSSPTLANQVEGQINLRDAVERTIEYVSPDGRQYALKPDTAVLMVRPRGWHLLEKHVCVTTDTGVDPLAGAFFDFGLFAFHNAKTLAAQGLGPFFYLPKMQSHREAQLWDEVLAFAEVRLGLPIGTMKATVLIETLPAAFEMDEILHALRGRVVGLNCGRWDYIFSYLKTFRRHRDRVLPERGQVTMTVPFLKAYSELLIKTCHRRGAHAMGGMAAQIPIAGDPIANGEALARVRADKLREVTAGHDGTWVAHPGLIPIAREVFDAGMPKANQVDRLRDDVEASRDALIGPNAGTITRKGFENNVEVCVRYLAAWLDGLGCVPIHNLMEDAATAEIARAQLWQWLHVVDAGVSANGPLAADESRRLALDDGTPIDFALFDRVVASIPDRLQGQNLPGSDRIAQAAWMLAELTHADTLADFLTLPAYELIQAKE